MTPARLDTIVANLPSDGERDRLLELILEQLTYGEIIDALTSIWDRIQARVAAAHGEYSEEVERIEAEEALAAEARRAEIADGNAYDDSLDD